MLLLKFYVYQSFCTIITILESILIKSDGANIKEQAAELAKRN